MDSRMAASPAPAHENAAAFPASAKNRPTAPATVARSHAVRRPFRVVVLMSPLPVTSSSPYPEESADPGDPTLSARSEQDTCGVTGAPARVPPVRRPPPPKPAEKAEQGAAADGLDGEQGIDPRLRVILLILE